MSSTQYLGRSVDLLAYDNIIVTPGVSLLVPALATAGGGGKIVTGLAKLMQRFIIRLFTVRGSVHHFPTEGCQFRQDASSGRLRTITDVFSSFSSSVSDIKEQFFREQKATDPDDEIFENAELLSVSFSGDRLTLLIQITTAAGRSAQFIMPLEVTV
jgi:hypothetical protein